MLYETDHYFVRSDRSTSVGPSDEQGSPPSGLYVNPRVIHDGQRGQRITVLGEDQGLGADHPCLEPRHQFLFLLGLL